MGKETGTDGPLLLRQGRVLAQTEPVIRSAISRIKLDSSNETNLFLPHYEAMKNQEHPNGTFDDPGQENNKLYRVGHDRVEYLVRRDRRQDSKRTRVWYGVIGRGEKLMKNAALRDQLRDGYDLIGLEMEAAGTMNRIPVDVIRGVCDYADKHKNWDWQPYAATMAAACAKAILSEILVKGEPSSSIAFRSGKFCSSAVRAMIDLHNTFPPYTRPLLL